MQSLTNSLWAVFLVAMATSHLATARPSYAVKLPNGNRVQSPCNAAEFWPGVGHFEQAGGGPRNEFGLDFSAEGLKWTQQLCRKDSDGDGKTNGQELGDPDCVWKEGATPSRTDGITHPGICEPVGSDKCAKINGDFKCPDEFNCSAIHQAGVRQMPMRLKRSAVPPKETTYMCQAFEVSNRTKEHMIAAVPVIDNPAVLHHMIIYGCTTKPNVALDTPFECNMGAANCINLIDLWGLGMRPGNCYRDNVGAPFGLQGYQYVVLQLHWNNPTGISNWHDASGFDLYFSPTLRQFDTGVMMYGQVKLDLAPRQKEIHRMAVSDKRCSDELLPKDGYKLLWGTLHMHLYGTRGQVSLWRNGQKVRDLIPMHSYDYDTPIIFEYDQPIDYLPGDEIRTDCYYSTAGTNRSVYWGESTQEEMCYSFFQYFPHNRTKAQSWPNVDLVSSFGKIDYCVLGMKSVEKYYIDGCDVKAVQSGELVRKYLKDVDSECRHSHQYRCSDQCLAWYRSVKANEPCLNGDALDFTLLSYRHYGNEYNRRMVAYIDMCAERDQRDKLEEAQSKIDELNKRPPPPAQTHSLLSYDVRLLIVSGSYLAGLLLTALLVLVIFKMKKSSVASIESKSIAM